MNPKLIRPDYYDEDYVINEYEYKGMGAFMSHHF